MENIKIGDEIFHPCSIDIIKHKVTSIRQFEGFNHYILKATHNVGSCGKIEVVISEHKGKLRFIELLYEEDIESSGGLQDFIEGNYYRTLQEARSEFYTQQRTWAWSNMEEKERLYKEAKDRYNQVDLLVKSINNTIKSEMTILDFTPNESFIYEPKESKEYFKDYLDLFIPVVEEKVQEKNFSI